MRESKAERKLSKAVDELVGEMAASYRASLSDWQKIDRNLADAKLRDDIVESVREQLRCRMMSERALDTRGIGMEYELQTLVSSGYLRIKVLARRVSE